MDELIELTLFGRAAFDDQGTYGQLTDIFGGLQRLFEVPDMVPGPQIPFSRVNHNKYMVTDEVAYIGEYRQYRVVRWFS